jgi:hypothetical protein
MVLEFAASLLSLMKALPEPKRQMRTIKLLRIDKCMIGKGLAFSSSPRG